MQLQKETKELLLDAALEIFSENGFNGATTKAIAEKAGVNEVTLFRHFGNKEALFNAVIERDLNIKVPYMAVKIDPDDDPIETITELSMLMYDVMSERSRISKLIIREGQRVGSDHMQRIGPTQGIDMLTKVFKGMGATDPEMCSMVMGSFIIRSVLFKSFLGKDPVVTLDRDVMKRFAENIVHGMNGVKA